MSTSVGWRAEPDTVRFGSRSRICAPLWPDENTSARRLTSLTWAWRVTAQ